MAKKAKSQNEDSSFIQFEQIGDSYTGKFKGFSTLSEGTKNEFSVMVLNDKIISMNYSIRTLIKPIADKIKLNDEITVTLTGFGKKKFKGNLAKIFSVYWNKKKLENQFNFDLISGKESLSIFQEKEKGKKK